MLAGLASSGGCGSCLRALQPPRLPKHPESAVDDGTLISLGVLELFKKEYSRMCTVLAAFSPLNLKRSPRVVTL